MNLQKIIYEIYNYDFSYVTQDIENNSLDIDEVKEIELPNYTLSFNLKLSILLEESSYSWNNPVDYNIVKDVVEISDLKVQGENITEDQQEELQEIIENEIISTYR